MKSKEKVLIVIPAYNEEKNILQVCDSIKDFNKKNKVKYDVIVINDGSFDNTEKVLTDNNISYIQLIHNLGIGGAVQTGYKYALENNYDIAIQFDGDGQHDVHYIDNIIKPLLKNEADMVIGSRFIDKSSSSFHSSFTRRVGIKLISFVMKIKTKKKIYDTTSGFRAINKKLIKRFAENYPLEYPEPISTVDVINSNFKVKEIPVNMLERKEGKSSIKYWKSAYYMINVILTILLMKKR